MNEMTMEVLKLVASFLTPLIILILGIVINKKLESAKAVLSKEKDWQNWWAGKFLSTCHNYNESVTDIVTGLFQVKQIEDEKLSGWENESKENLNDIRHSMRKLQYLDWEIQNYIQFAHEHGPTVLEKGKNLYGLIGSLTSKRQGNLEEIRKIQFEFNNAVRLAHAEILGLAAHKYRASPNDLHPHFKKPRSK
jgi:hypothetical protein